VELYNKPDVKSHMGIHLDAVQHKRHPSSHYSEPMHHSLKLTMKLAYELYMKCHLCPANQHTEQQLLALLSGKGLPAKNGLA
jgi:hypothetical protein